MRGDDVGGPIRWKLHLPAPPETVYRALASDEGRASFWAAYLAFGIDLRDHDRDRLWDGGYLDG